MCLRTSKTVEYETEGVSVNLEKCKFNLVKIKLALLTVEATYIGLPTLTFYRTRKPSD
jgi:hypothetical protein